MTTPAKKIPVIGVLGGIGSGKSTVARLFGALGCAVIDADALAHDIIDAPEVKDVITSQFGADMVGPDGRVDRRAVARVAFADKEKIALLNSLIHPRAWARTEEAIAAARQEGRAKAIVIDAPLLVEAGWHERCDFLVFVESHIDNRAARARQRAGLSRLELEEREKFQISLDRKAQLAYYTINNNSDLSSLEGQVCSVFSRITG
jgi:dephospho-CoA kinase